MPSTTSGRYLNIATALCHSARSRFSGSISLRSRPLPRRPEKFTHAMS
jgi:hypothetical protein